MDRPAGQPKPYTRDPVQYNRGETLEEKASRLRIKLESARKNGTLKSSPLPRPNCEDCFDSGWVYLFRRKGEESWQRVPTTTTANLFQANNLDCEIVAQVCLCREYQRAQKAIDSIMNGQAGVPEDFKGYSFDTWDRLHPALFIGKEQAREACEVFANGDLYTEETDETKYGLVLAGEVGTGKSGLASATLMERARRGSSVLWIDFSKFLRKVRNTYEDDHQVSYDEIISATANVGCLLFDDFGDARRIKPITDNVREIVYDVVGERYNEHRPTIFTTNLTKTQLLDQFGDRLASRILRICHWQEMTGINIRNQYDPMFNRER